jgi:hypothetical protein
MNALIVQAKKYYQDLYGSGAEKSWGDLASKIREEARRLGIPDDEIIQAEDIVIFPPTLSFWDLVELADHTSNAMGPTGTGLKLGVTGLKGVKITKEYLDDLIKKA